MQCVTETHVAILRELCGCSTLCPIDRLGRRRQSPWYETTQVNTIVASSRLNTMNAAVVRNPFSFI